MKLPALIELFLIQLKQFVEKNSFILVPRDVSKEFMASRGMSMETLTSVILSLEAKDCFDGRSRIEAHVTRSGLWPSFRPCMTGKGSI